MEFEMNSTIPDTATGVAYVSGLLLDTELKRPNVIVPICSFCGRTRNDEGHWEQVEDYVKLCSEANLSHGLCLECARQHYPDFV